MFKSRKGITLLALIITIIVLLILAAVTINMVLGENGLFNKAKTSVAKYENAQGKENSALAGYETEIDNARDTVTIDKSQYEQLLQDVAELKANDNKKGKLLWEGSWTDNSINVPGISNYTMCIAVGPASSNGTFLVNSGIISMNRAYFDSNSSDEKIIIHNKRFSISNDTLTTIGGGSFQIYTNSNTWASPSVQGIKRVSDEITKIYGLF